MINGAQAWQKVDLYTYAEARSAPRPPPPRLARGRRDNEEHDDDHDEHGYHHVQLAGLAHTNVRLGAPPTHPPAVRAVTYVLLLGVHVARGLLLALEVAVRVVHPLQSVP